jgi:adenylate cyclase
MMVAMLIALALVFIWNGLRIDGKLVRDHEETLLLQSFFSLRGNAAPPSNLAIIKIDDTSYQKLGVSTRKPFPRAIFAKALKTIQDDKPAVVILDLHAPKEEGEEDGTRLLAEALRMGPSTIARAPIAPSIRDSDENSQEVAKEVSYVSDQMIREAASMELPLVVDNYHGKTYYLRRGHEQPLKLEDSIPLLNPIKTYVKADIEVPDQDALINFYGPGGTIRSHSLWQLFETDRVIPQGFFKDKVVFLGFSSDLAMRGTSDKEVLAVTAPGGSMYGVEIQATIASNLLDGSWIRRIPKSIESFALFISLFVLIFGIFILEPASALLYTTLWLSLWYIVSFLAFRYLGLFMPGSFLATFSIPTIFAGVACTVATVALKELRETKKMMGLG